MAMLSELDLLCWSALAELPPGVTEMEYQQSADILGLSLLQSLTLP